MKYAKYLLLAICLSCSPAFAQAPPKSYVLSAQIVEDVFGQLSKEPYANVVQLIAKLQYEVQHQPPPVLPTPPRPEDPPKPPDPPKQ